MKNILVAAAAVAALSSTAASAQGLYAEIHGGWDNVSVAGESDDGIAYGAAIGYELPVSDKAFVGLEASADDSSTKECMNDVLALGDRACVIAGRDLSVVARAGFEVAAGSQLYALAGYTNARIKLTYTDGVNTGSIADNGDGFRFGAGYKRVLGGSTYAKAEYRYSNYESDFSRHQVLFGLGMNF